MDLFSRCRIHPTALISPEAELAPDVHVGPYAILEGKVRLGPGCIIHPRAYLIGPITMGRDNRVFTNAIIGERPQHLRYNNEVTSVEIGDGNIFRENVTIHRGTSHSWVTRIGSGNFFMAGSHVAHDCHIGNKCIFANNATLGGHCVIHDNAYLAGAATVHQFCRMGRYSFLSGVSGSSKDIPPFIMQQEINKVVGVNVVGMRRAGFTPDQINSIRRVYHIVFLQNLILPNALAKVEEELGDVDVVQEFVAFVRESQRGINRDHSSRLDAAA